MASQLKVDTLTGVTTAGSIVVTGEGNSTTTNLQQGLAKSWAKVTKGSDTINDSFSVTSITDTDTGKTSVNSTVTFGNINGEKRIWNSLEFEDVEVIGNIWENKELLEK